MTVLSAKGRSFSSSSFYAITARFYSVSQVAAIRRTRIGIAGAGGLGSNCAHALVRCGFERLVIADFDRIELSNLNRQFFFIDQIGRPKVDALRENLRRINPALSVKVRRIRLEQSSMRHTFEDCDVVVEALDSAVMKAALVTALAPSGKLVVAASGIGGFGRSDRIRTRRVGKNVIIVGDGVSAVSDQLMPLAPRVMVAAAKMADAVLEWVLMHTAASERPGSCGES